MSSAGGKVLVTGGAGYIGSVLVGQLLRAGYPVRVIDNLSFGGQALLAYYGQSDFEFLKGDVADNADISRALDGITTVVHLAAIVGDPACSRYPELAVKVNQEGSELLCRKAAEQGVNRFVFASTCSNYGKMPDPNGFVDETAPLNPVSLYAELKVGFEDYLMKIKQVGFTPVCLRFATAYGLSARPRFDLTVNEFTRDLALGKKLDVFGEQFWRPYCHVSDIARACLAAIEADPVAVDHQAFNVGDTSENYQKKTLVEMIVNELPQARGLVRYVSRVEDPRDYRVNFDKIGAVLKFRTSRRVIDGIREIIFAIRSGLIRNPDDVIYRNI